jgi:hypothetical protein
MIKTVTKSSVAEVLQAKPRSMERRAMKYGAQKTRSTESRAEKYKSETYAEQEL